MRYYIWHDEGSCDNCVDDDLGEALRIAEELECDGHEGVYISDENHNLITLTPWELSVDLVRDMHADTYRALYEALEDQNYHPEALVLEAKRTGNRQFAERAEALLAAQMAAGELTPNLYAKRQALRAEMAGVRNATIH